MAETFVFEIVSPEKLLFSKPVAMVTIPGSEGEYGVLPHHAPMITKVKAGVIEVFAETDTAVSDRLFVASGFAEVTETRCTVLATEALALADLNRSQLDQQAKEIEEKLLVVNEAERVLLLEQKEIVRAKIEATQTI